MQMALSTQRSTLCLPSFCDVPSPSCVSRRLMLQIFPASLMTNPIVTMDHPARVTPKQASCFTSQSLPPASQDSQTPSEFAGAWSVGAFASALTTLHKEEWMHISALVFGKNWLRLYAIHSGHFLALQLSSAATLTSGGLRSTWAERGTAIASCFHSYTSFSKVVVCLLGTTSGGPHTLLERLLIWSSHLWNSHQEVSSYTRATSAAL